MSSLRPDAPDLARLVEGQCVSPAGTAIASPSRIVIVPAGESITDGFSRARKLLDSGEVVRILGCGITYPETWPAWATEEPSLSLAELGVYERRTRMEASRPLAASLSTWCDRVFRGVIPGLDGAEVFSSGAAGRLLQDAMDCAALVEGLKTVHPEAPIEAIDPAWAGYALLSTEGADRTGARRLVLPVVVALGVVASALRTLREFRRGAASRKKMRENNLGRPPAIWLALTPDWLRANKHLIDTLGTEALSRGESVGVLLIGSWGVGARDEISQSIRGTELWPGLGTLRDHFPDRVCVAGAVMPDRFGKLITTLLRGAVASFRATIRALRLGPPPHGRDKPVELAKLLSHDVVSAVLAAEAAQQARQALAPDARIVFCGASLPTHAAPERVLHRLGVATAEYMHGLGSDSWHGMAESRVDTRFVWSLTDAKGLRPTGQTNVVAGLPASPSRARGQGHCKIAILTNYYHRNIVVPHGGTKRGPYQRELLTIPELLREALPDQTLEFRWRPHPAEVSELVQRDLHNLANVELSQNRSLEDDLDWADLVVTAHSSVAAQSMFTGLPVFVHLRPELVGSPFTAYVSDERAFQTAEEAVRLIVACFRALADGDPDALHAERLAREALVGAPAPQSLYDAATRWAAVP